MSDENSSHCTPPRRRRRRQFKPARETDTDATVTTIDDATNAVTVGETHAVDTSASAVAERDAPKQLSAEKPRRPRRRRPFTSSSPSAPPSAAPTSDTTANSAGEDTSLATDATTEMPLDLHDVGHEDDAWDFGCDATDHGHAATQPASHHHNTATVAAVDDPAQGSRSPTHTPSKQHRHPATAPDHTSGDHHQSHTSDDRGGGSRHDGTSLNHGPSVPAEAAACSHTPEEGVGEVRERNGKKRTSNKRSPRRFFSALRGSRKKKDAHKQAASGEGSGDEARSQPTQQRSRSASRDKLGSLDKTQDRRGDTSKDANMEVVQRIRKQHERQLLDEQQNGVIGYDATEIAMPARIPLSIRRCIQYISSPRALKEEGLFRVSGNKRRIDELQTLFSAGQDPPLGGIMDPSTICGLLKLNLREHELPIDRKSAQRMLRAIEGGTTYDKQLRRVRKVLSSLTPLRFETFRALLLLLRKVVGWEGNRMKVSNLSTSVGPTIFPAMAAQNCSKVLGFLLRNLDACFQDSVPSSRQSCASTTTATSTPYSGATLATLSARGSSTSPANSASTGTGEEEERLRRLVLEDTQARSKAPVLRF